MQDFVILKLFDTKKAGYVLLGLLQFVVCASNSQWLSVSQRFVYRPALPMTFENSLGEEIRYSSLRLVSDIGLG